MNILNHLKSLVPFMFILIFLSSCSTTKEHELVISNVNIIDVSTGNVLQGKTVAIDSNSISVIYDGKINVSDATRVIDGTAKFLIPGLWDMHVHHKGNYDDSNPLLIANGVTGVREMWGDMYYHQKILKGITEGTMDVPDVYTGSPIIDGEPVIWPGSIGVSNAEEAKKTVIEQIESGVDFLKVYSLLNKESFDAIAEVANERGIPFAGHVPDEVTIQHAARMGMVSVEHLTGVLYGAIPSRDSLISAGIFEYPYYDQAIHSFNSASFDSLCQLLVREDLWMCPTLITNKGSAFRADPEFINDARLNYLPDHMTFGWTLDSVELADPNRQERIRQNQEFFNFTLPLVGQMHSKGVRFMAGSDYPNPFCYPGFSLHDELALMVEGGMDNLAALQTATLNPAVFMGKEDQFGSIEAGKTASLVLLAKNPLEQIENSSSIEAVVLRGKPYEKEALTQMLQDVKTKLQMPRIGQWLTQSIKNNGIETALDSLDIFLESDNLPYLIEESDINRVGYYFMQSGDLSTALNLFEKNTMLFPEEFNVYDSYGEALMANGQLDESYHNYKKASELNPYYPHAKIMLDSLEILRKTSD